jgi:hypothetical protein
MNAIMPILPLDHPEPLAATLGVMLYPGEDEADQKRARAYAAQFLAKPVERFREAGGTLTAEVLARLHADCGVPLDDVKARWRDGTATGQLFEIYFKLAQTHPKLASWENAVRLVRANAVKHDVSASRSLLHQARSRYRSVMHLWGAWCMRGRAIRSDPDAGYDGWNDFQFFLTEAEILLEWGRTWWPERANAEPPLSGEAWRVPEGWKPPETGWPRTKVALAIPDELLVHLRKSGRPRKSA